MNKEMRKKHKMMTTIYTQGYMTDKYLDRWYTYFHLLVDVYIINIYLYI